MVLQEKGLLGVKKGAKHTQRPYEILYIMMFHVEHLFLSCRDYG